LDLALKTRARWWAWLAMTCLLAASPAAAAAADRPAWLWPLGLSADDQGLLLRLSPASPDALKSQGRALLLSLAQASPWKAQVVADHIKDALALERPQKQLDAAQSPVQQLTHQLAAPGGCPKLAATLERFLEALESGGSPLPPVEAGEATGACAVRLDPSMRIVTIPARLDQQVEVLVFGPSFAALLRPPAISIKGRGVSFLAAPLDARVLVMTQGLPSAMRVQVPAAELVFVDDDGYAHLSAPACIDLTRLRTSPHATVFVNGLELAAGVSSLSLLRPQDGATIQVFDSAGQAVYRRELSRLRLEGSRTCTLVEDDASASIKKTVLVEVSTTEACSDRAVDPLKIRTQVSDFLGADYETRGVEVLDVLNTVANVQTDIKSLMQGAAPAGAQAPVSPTGGNADVARALQDVGFSLALTLDIRCTHTSGDVVQYTIVGRRIDLDALVEAADREDRARRMDAMGKVISSEIQTQQGDQNLRGLLQATVGRLFHLPYVRFADDESEETRRGDVMFHIEASVPGAEKSHAKMYARRAEADTDRSVCTALVDYNAVRSTRAVSIPPASGGWPEDRELTSDGTALGVVEIPFYPVEPGHYLVRVSVPSGDGKTSVETARCVHILEPKYSLAVEIDHLGGFALGRAWQSEGVATTYVMGGIARHKDESYGFGLLAGLGYTMYTATTPPSWTDISKSASASTLSAMRPPGAVLFAPDGTTDLTWTRVSLAAALSFEWRLVRLAYLFPGWDRWRRFIQGSSLRASGIYIGATPLVDFGWYFVGNLPSGLSDLRGNATHPFDIDGSLLVSLFYKVNLPEGQTLKIGVQAALLGFDDFGRHDARTAADVTYDSWLAVGPQFAFGWSP
jgi:hypothetical protein